MPSTPAQDEQGLIYLDYNATTPVHPEVLEAMIASGFRAVSIWASARWY